MKYDEDDDYWDDESPEHTEDPRVRRLLKRKERRRIKHKIRRVEFQTYDEEE